MPMEKQNTVENQLAHTITQTEFDSDYDKTAKKLLANKQILAQIMKGCVDEYSECSVDEIAEKYIEGTPEVGTVGVHVDDTNRPPKAPEIITGSNNEDSTLTEGTIHYDVRFDAIAPTAVHDAASRCDSSYYQCGSTDCIQSGIPADKTCNLLLQQNDLCTAWADIQKIGVWKNPKSVFYMGLYKTV